MRDRGYGWWTGLVVLACGVLYLVGNERIALWDRDEPRYALASRWMLTQGDWIVPRVGWGENPTEPRTAKPVFIYWSQAAAMAMFGVNEFAARFPSSLAMVGTLALVGAAIARFVGPRRATWAVLIMGTSAMVIVSAKMCVTDSVLLLFVTTAQLALLTLYRARNPHGTITPGGGVRPWAPVVMWIAIALAGLTKGPVVLGVQFMTMLVLLMLDVGGRWRKRTAWAEAIRWWRSTQPFLGLAIIALICGPWLLMLHVREPGFLPWTLGHDVIARSTRALEGHKGPPGFYLVTIFATFFPWSLLLPMSIGIAIRHRRLPITRFALAAIVGPWIMMELVATKLVHYVLPIFPPLAFLVADALVRCFRGQYADLRGRLAVYGTGGWALIVSVLGLAPWLGWYYFYDFPRAAATVVTFVMIAWAVLVFELMRRAKPRAAMVSIGVGMFVAMLLMWGWFLPRAEFLKLAARAGGALVDAGAIHPGQVVMLHRYREQSLAFYQGGTIQEAFSADLLLTEPPHRWPRWIVLTWGDWKRLPDSHRRHLDKLATFDGLNIAKGDLVHLMVLETRAVPRLPTTQAAPAAHSEPAR